MVTEMSGHGEKSDGETDGETRLEHRNMRCSVPATKKAPTNCPGKIETETDAQSVVGAQQLNVRSTPQFSN